MTNAIPKVKVRRNEIWMCDLGEGLGSEQGGKRPVLILQNNIGNEYSPTTIIAPFTSKQSKKQIPTHVTVLGCGLVKPSTVLLEQLRTVDICRLCYKIGEVVDEDTLLNINKGIYISVSVKLKEVKLQELEHQEKCSSICVA